MVTRTRKRAVIGSYAIKAKPYPLMLAAVEAGVAYGWNRAHKHTDAPAPEAIRDAIADAVMNQICESFCFDGEDA